ncbi:MAG: DUF2927 domain-containing protein [Desulfomicrobium sp.]|nr:DUF2927 domain-containing protein [Desulfomicrobium sp.]
MNKNVLFILAMALVFVTGPARANTDEIMLDYVPSGKITRFEEPVQFWIGGKDRLEGQYYIDTVVNEVRRIIPRLSFSQVSSANQANIRFYLTDSKDEWQEAVTRSSLGMAGWKEMGDHIRGFTLLASSGGVIKKADIVLHLDFQTSGGQKLWIVRHELMHALGIMAHPGKTLDSVLNSRQAQEEKNSVFSDSDILVLQTIYGQ